MGCTSCIIVYYNDVPRVIVGARFCCQASWPVIARLIGGPGSFPQDYICAK